ncbi:hypothetical protein V8J36_04175 [Frigidibacter sp. MR17.14]|uniref:hypothetical protein n=1 Tax=Frigidibacter sp. MR17.14 TaxID=3126509 RepID=UPI003012DF2C
MDVPLHQHWHDIYLKRWLIVLTAVVAAAVAWGASAVLTPVYEAKTTFYLASTAVPASFSTTAPEAPQPPLLPMPEEKAASIDIGILRGTEMMGRLAAATGSARDALVRAIDVTVSKEFMVDFYVRDPDPERAAEIANLVPDLYRGFHEEQMRRGAAAVAEALGTELAGLQAERDRLRGALAQARSDSLSAADAAALGARERDRDAAREALAALDADQARQQARIAAIGQALAQEAALYRDEQTADTTPALDAMQQRVLDLRVQLASASAASPAGPQRATLEQEIAATEAAIADERRRLRDAGAKPQGSLHEALRLDLARALADQAASAAGRPAAAARVSEADARFDAVLAALALTDADAAALAAVEARLAATRQSLDAARLQAAHVAAPLVVVSPALAPPRAAFPLPVLNTAVAALTGMILGAYYALWLAHAERGAEARRTQVTPLPFFTRDERLALIRGGAAGLREGSGEPPHG